MADDAGGLYVLILDVEKAFETEVGSLGIHRFHRGRYAYVGSARSGLEARVARHLERHKPLRWHIDYLTTAPWVEVRDVVMLDAPPFGECELNRRVIAHAGGEATVPGFGATDCREDCPAHLVRAGDDLSAQALAEAVRRPR